MAMQLELKWDPLIRGPLTEPVHGPAEISLPAAARPVKRYCMRREPFGYVLSRGNRLVAAATESDSVLAALEGSLTLSEVKEQFGPAAINLVGALYESGLVELH